MLNLRLAAYSRFPTWRLMLHPGIQGSEPKVSFGLEGQTRTDMQTRFSRHDHTIPSS